MARSGIFPAPLLSTGGSEWALSRRKLLMNLINNMCLDFYSSFQFLHTFYTLLIATIHKTHVKKLAHIPRAESQEWNHWIWIHFVHGPAYLTFPNNLPPEICGTMGEMSTGPWCNKIYL